MKLLLRLNVSAAAPRSFTIIRDFTNTQVPSELLVSRMHVLSPAQSRQGLVG
jgi:hypothetical protein